MIAKGNSISHGQAVVSYDLKKSLYIYGQEAGIAHVIEYGNMYVDVPDADMIIADFDRRGHDAIKNKYMRFELCPTLEESQDFTDEDWRRLVRDFVDKLKLNNHQYVAIYHAGTEKDPERGHVHLVVNRVSLGNRTYKDNFLGRRTKAAAEAINRERGWTKAEERRTGNQAELVKTINESLLALDRPSWDGLFTELRKRGYKPSFSRKGDMTEEKTGQEQEKGEPRGWSVRSRSGVRYAASRIGRLRGADGKKYSPYTAANLSDTWRRMIAEQERKNATRSFDSLDEKNKERIRKEVWTKSLKVLAAMGRYDFNSYKIGLAKEGIKVKELYNSKGGQNGYRFIVEGVEVKASAIDQRLSLAKLPGTWEHKRQTDSVAAQERQAFVRLARAGFKDARLVREGARLYASCSVNGRGYKVQIGYREAGRLDELRQSGSDQYGDCLVRVFAGAVAEKMDERSDERAAWYAGYGSGYGYTDSGDGEWQSLLESLLSPTVGGPAVGGGGGGGTAVSDEDKKKKKKKGWGR